ncbi:MAG TPA: hypothetical protein DDZ81_00070 [Acetobacteraceae bacterium]|nr:hypothetical protein [Acetobacteraceae bacterium]
MTGTVETQDTDRLAMWCVAGWPAWLLSRQAGAPIFTSFGLAEAAAPGRKSRDGGSVGHPNPDDRARPR